MDLLETAKCVADSSRLHPSELREQLVIGEGCSGFEVCAQRDSMWVASVKVHWQSPCLRIEMAVTYR